MSDDLLHPSVTLNKQEAYGLALRLAVYQLGTDWLEWEDVPWLDEASFELVEEASKAFTASVLEGSHQFDVMQDIDSADLFARATA